MAGGFKINKKEITIEMIECVKLMAKDNDCYDNDCCCDYCPTEDCMLDGVVWGILSNMSDEAIKWLEDNKEEIARVRGEYEETDLSSNEFNTITISKTKYDKLKEKAEKFDKIVEFINENI